MPKGVYERTPEQGKRGSKPNEQRAVEMVALRKQGLPLTEIGFQFSVSPQAVSGAIARHYHRTLGSPPPRRRFSREEKPQSEAVRESLWERNAIEGSRKLRDAILAYYAKHHWGQAA